MMPAARAACLVVLGIACAEPVAAQAPAGAGSIDMADAARLTLMLSPEIAAVRQAADAAEGQYRLARGSFDSSVTVNPASTYLHVPLTPALTQFENFRRMLNKAFADTFLPLADNFRQQAETLDVTSPPCPAVLNESQGAGAGWTVPLRRGPTWPPARDPTSSVFTFQYVNTKFGDRTIGNLQSTAATTDLCAPRIGPSRIERMTRWSATVNRVSSIDPSLQDMPDDVVTAMNQMSHETNLRLESISRAVGTRAALAYARLGPLPFAQVQRQVSLDALYSRPFRNGLLLGTSLQVHSQEDSYWNKPLDPTFGGMTVPNQFQSGLSLSLFVPLGQGRGTISNTAPERAAGFALAASRDQIRHQATVEVYRTVLAYVALQAAQARLAMLEQSAVQNAELVTVTEAQARVGETPGIDVTRARARAAAVNAAVREARATETSARSSLAGTIGLSPASADAMPRATQPLAVRAIAIADVGELVRLAAANRRDARAVDQLRQASAALDAGARGDLRRSYDFSISGGMANIYWSSLFAFMPSEAGPIYSDSAIDSEFDPVPPPQPPAVRFYDPAGYWRSITGRWRPFVQAQFTVRFAVHNDAAIGRATQARADLRAREIQATDLDRTVRTNISSLVGEIDATAAALARAEDTASLEADTLAGTVEMFRAGEATLVDVISTEQQITADRLETVRLRQLYVSLVARLRYETGTLVAFAGDGTGAEAMSFDPATIFGK